MTGDPRKISRPPKFAKGTQSPGPSILSEWLSFWRWLVNLWEVASNSADAQEVVAITPRPTIVRSDQEILGEAQSFQRQPIPPAPREFDAALLRALQVPTAIRPGDQLTALQLAAMNRPPYPVRPDVHTIAIEDVHERRYTSGSITTAGTTITRVTGLAFRADMVGELIAITIPVTGYVLYRVVSFTSGNIIDIDTNIGILGTTFIYSAHPATSSEKGSFYYEVDRGLLYLDSDSQGTVNTNGTTVTRTAGDFFDPYWGLKATGASILINGTSYRIDHVAAAGVLILATSAGVHAGLSYTVTAGKWIYCAGQMQDGLANLPTDVSPYDLGLIFLDSTYQHSYRFDGTGWAFAPGDPGSAYIAAGAPGAGWAVCDGSVVQVSVGDGTTHAVTTPNLTGDVFLKGVGIATAQQVATVPTWQAGAKTDDESAHTHDVLIPGTAVDSGSGAPANVAVPGIYTTGAGTAHHHDLSNANAKLNVPSEGNGGLPLRIGLVWWLRQ